MGEHNAQCTVASISDLDLSKTTVSINHSPSVQQKKQRLVSNETQSWRLAISSPVLAGYP